MNKIFLFVAMLGLVSKSQITFAQTDYTGIANVNYDWYCVPHDCGYNKVGISKGNIRYRVFNQSGLPDSIIYEISIFSIGIQLHFEGLSSQIAYLKNDADSIVFNFGFHFFTDTLRCQQYEDYTGIARISTVTAGITPKEIGALTIELSPNPTTGLLRIKTNAHKAIVVDCVGRIAISQDIGAYDNLGFSTINVSSLASGCYTLVLDDGVKKIATKFIKY